MLISGDMTPEDLKARTKKFAIDVIRFAKTAIPEGHVNRERASQLTSAATSSAAGYRAACRARSRADFVYKLGNAIEETDEAAFWLEVLTESDITPPVVAAVMAASRRADQDPRTVA